MDEKMRGTYIGNNRMLVSPIWGGKLLVSSNDRSLMPELVISGFYDIALTKYIIKQIKPGNFVVDIGANLGYFTILLAYMVGAEGKVIAFEADDENVTLIQENVSVNYLNDHVKIINKAVYSENTTISFFATENFKGNGSIYKHDEAYLSNFGNENIVENKIEAVKLDHLLGSLKTIDFIKIDIEGGEYHALKGMSSLMENEIIKSMIFEFNKKMLRQDVSKLYQLIQNWLIDYYLFFLTDEGDEVPVSIDEVFSRDSISSVGMKRR
jgi:FkbM family methyltransferase